jgi:hypothetical protein
LDQKSGGDAGAGLGCRFELAERARNGRACVTCHQPANALSVSTATLRERWKEKVDRLSSLRVL